MNEYSILFLFFLPLSPYLTVYGFSFVLLPLQTRYTWWLWVHHLKRASSQPNSDVFIDQSCARMFKGLHQWKWIVEKNTHTHKRAHARLVWRTKQRDAYGWNSKIKQEHVQSRGRYVVRASSHDAFFMCQPNIARCVCIFNRCNGHTHAGEC